jgi:hypothetical protein
VKHLHITYANSSNITNQIYIARVSPKYIHLIGTVDKYDLIDLFGLRNSYIYSNSYTMPDRMLMPCACGMLGTLLGFIFSQSITDPCLGMVIGAGTCGSLGCILTCISCIMDPPCKDPPLPIASVVEPVVVQNIYLVCSGQDKYPSNQDKMFIKQISASTV